MIFKGGAWAALIWVRAFSGRSNPTVFAPESPVPLLPFLSCVLLPFLDFVVLPTFHSTLGDTQMTGSGRNLKKFSATETSFRINHPCQNDAFDVALSIARG